MKPEKITEEQIAAWRAKYGEVSQVTIEDKVCYLRKPDRSTLSMAATLGKSDSIKYSEIMLEKCWLGGHEEIKTVDEYFFAAAGKVAELIKIKKATVKKL